MHSLLLRSHQWQRFLVTLYLQSNKEKLPTKIPVLYFCETRPKTPALSWIPDCLPRHLLLGT